MSQLGFENVDGLCVYSHSVICQVVPVMDDWLQKSSNSPLWLLEYITSNCGLECTGFETAGAFIFVGIKDSAHPGLID